MSAKRKRTPSEKNLALAANNSTIRLNFETQQRTDKPTEFRRIVERARYFAEEIEWLQVFLPLKLSVYNFGLKLSPGPDESGKPPADGDAKKLDEWLDAKTSIDFEPYEDPITKKKITPELSATNRELIQNFTEDCWREFLLLDNLVALWLDDVEYPSILPPEKCEYTDTLGVPIMRFEHGMAEKDKKLLPPEQQKVFKDSTVLLNVDDGQHFKVLKRSRVGTGFTKPSIHAIFRLLGEIESKQIAMNSLAFCMRKVTRWHKIGHEIKSGDRAGKNLHFYTTQRANAIKKLWVEVVGVDDYVSNFDETIEWPWPDSKMFSDDYFKSGLRRLEDWGGPLAIMLRASNQMPYLMPLLKAQATLDRDKMAQFLAQAINAAYAPPVPIRLSWSNMIFNEARLAMELMKFGFTNRLVSNATAAREIGLDPDTEDAQKLAEANDPERIKKHTPIWDPSHGTNPIDNPKPPAGAEGGKGQKPGAQPGKPPGSSDAT